jgi:hypothetical protein
MKKEYKPYGLLHLFLNPFTTFSEQWELHLNLAGSYRKHLDTSPNGSAIILATTFPADETKEEILYYAEQIVKALEGANIENTVPEDYEEWKAEAKAMCKLHQEKRDLVNK